MTAEGRALAVLAFWGRNMAPIRAKGWTWPGFDYREEEWRRLLALANTVSFDAFVSFQVSSAVLMIALIGLVVGGGAAIVVPLYQMMPSTWAPPGQAAGDTTTVRLVPMRFCSRR